MNGSKVILGSLSRFSFVSHSINKLLLTSIASLYFCKRKTNYSNVLLPRFNDTKIKICHGHKIAYSQNYDSRRKIGKGATFNFILLIMCNSIGTCICAIHHVPLTELTL